MFLLRHFFVAVMLLLCLSAQASTVSYYLDQSNTSAVPDGSNYLKVTINDLGGNINFMVETLAPLNSMAGSNYGIDQFAFNTTLSLTGANFSSLPSGWSYAGANNMDGFGSFTAKLAGNGSSRVAILSFSITGLAGDIINDYIKLSVGASPSQGNQNFAAHVAGFTLPGTTSAFFGGTQLVPVPLPAAVWLLGSGMLGLAGAAIRRHSC